MRTDRKGTLMQVTNFKTYSSKDVRKAIEKLQLNTLGSSNTHQLRRSTERPVKVLPIQEYSLKLNKRIQHNRNKLAHKPQSKSRFKVRPEVLEALLGNRTLTTALTGTSDVKPLISRCGPYLSCPLIQTLSDLQMPFLTSMHKFN